MLSHSGDSDALEITGGVLIVSGLLLGPGVGYLYASQPSRAIAPFALRSLGVILLGAGLDTRALRLARPGLVFFEVDRGDVLAYKRARLARFGYPCPARAIACDYTEADLPAALRAAGLDAAAPCLIVWEGNTMYLDEPTVRATLAPLLGALEAPTLCLDHVSRRLVEGRDHRRRADVACNR